MFIPQVYNFSRISRMHGNSVKTVSTFVNKITFLPDYGTGLKVRIAALQNVKVMVTLTQEKSRDHQSQQDSSCGEHEAIHPTDVEIFQWSIDLTD